ncbi:MAG: transketolase [Desulfobacterales bacterium]|nr:MAG: transketolase [Desulfobacterales bacterium]
MIVNEVQLDLPPTPDISLLQQTARKVRATCVQMAHDAQEGHLSGALSCVEILVVLFSYFLRLPNGNPWSAQRDRFVFSKGHACAALYAVLAETGYIPAEWLSGYAVADSPLPNHPCKRALAMLEMSSGSLGHGLGFATGMLYGLKMKNSPARGIVLMSDGECNEGSVWEAAMFARAQRLDRLIAIVDHNNHQAVGKHDELNGFTSLGEKFRSFGWRAVEVDGNDIQELIQILDRVPFAKGRPAAVIAKTKAGAGITFMENDQRWFYRTPTTEDLEAALQELNVRPIHKGQP